MTALLLAALLAQTAEVPRVVIAPDGKVRFQFYDPFATRVTVAGEFNGWNPEATAMRRGDTGVWTVDLALEPGRHEYKFVIDGQWEGGENRRATIVRGKGGVLEVLPDVPTFNTPYNSRIFFGGRAYAAAVMRKVNPDEVTDTGRWRLAPLEYDMAFRMRFSAGDRVTGFAELNMNREEDRFQFFFDEGEAVYAADDLQVFLWRRRRAVDFDHPLRFLDGHRDTLDDEIRMTGEERPAAHRFGRQFDRIRRNPSDNDFSFVRSGFQGAYVEWAPGDWFVQAFGADHIIYPTDMWGVRTARRFLGGAARIGATAVWRNEARGLIAAPNGGNSVPQRQTFVDTDGGVFNFPPGASGDGANDFPNYDMLALLDPDGPNRDAWYGLDASVEGPAGLVYLEAARHKKEWAFVAWEDGDGLRPGGNAFFNTSSILPGEFLVGGEGATQTVLLGGVWRPWDALAAEVSWRFDDASELVLDTGGTLVRVQPEQNTYAARLRYRGEVFEYAIEGARVQARRFPQTFLEASFDDLSFQDVRLVGVFDETRFRHRLRWRPWERLEVDLAQIFRRYDVLASRLETNEMRGAISIGFTNRLRGVAFGRLKFYNLPRALTAQPGNARRFFAPGFHLFFAVSPHITLSGGFGVDLRLDEDVEEGRLFFLREALARAQRPGTATTHTLDQILAAEEILENEVRFELKLDAVF